MGELLHEDCRGQAANYFPGTRDATVKVWKLMLKMEGSILKGATPTRFKGGHQQREAKAGLRDHHITSHAFTLSNLHVVFLATLGVSIEE